MKNLFVLVVLVLFAGMLGAQQRTVICGHITTAGKFKINIYEPLNGYYNSFYDDTSKVNSALITEDSIFRATKLDRPAFFCIRFTNNKGIFINRADVLLFPGDSVNLHFNLNDATLNWVKYNGANAAGQYLFNQINFVPFDKFIPVLSVLNGLPRNKNTFTFEIDNCVSRANSRFDSLKTQGKISQQFVASIRLTFKLLFYFQVIEKLSGNYEQRESISKNERDSIIDVLIAKMPDAAANDLGGMYLSTNYLDYYYQYLAYKRHHLSSVEEVFTNNKEYFASGQKYDLDKEIAPFSEIDNIKMREDMWAMKILDLIKFVPTFPSESLIEQYCTIFPDNHWERYLRNELKTYASSILKLTYELQSPVVFIDTNKKMETFDDLVRELPRGAPMFVDIWASWCGPCVDAFSANKSLDSLLLSKKISHVYISFDRQTDQMAWHNAINKYCLGGYHILADNVLVADIKRVIHVSKTVGTPFFIPRYLIVNANGKIVENDASSPLNLDLLKDQIEKGLQQNN